MSPWNQSDCKFIVHIILLKRLSWTAPVAVNRALFALHAYATCKIRLTNFDAFFSIFWMQARQSTKYCTMSSLKHCWIFIRLYFYFITLCLFCFCVNNERLFCKISLRKFFQHGIYHFVRQNYCRSFQKKQDKRGLGKLTFVNSILRLINFDCISKSLLVLIEIGRNRRNHCCLFYCCN